MTSTSPVDSTINFKMFSKGSAWIRESFRDYQRRLAMAPPYAQHLRGAALPSWRNLRTDESAARGGSFLKIKWQPPGDVGWEDG